MRLFVTVGTTEFEELIEAIDNSDFLQAFRENGFDEIIIQYGRGVYQPKNLQPELVKSLYSINLELFRFRDSLQAEFRKADLVIGHAGAGTVLDVMTLEKPMIVVINESLQENHQQELADALIELNYCLVSTPKQLLNTFKESRGKYSTSLSIAKFPIQSPEKFSGMLESMFDFKKII